MLATTVGLLAALTVTNLFVLLGVIRRLRTMAADKEPADLGMPEIGSRVRAFAETTVAGAPVTDDDLRLGAALAVFLSPSCPPCLRTADELSRRRNELPTLTFVFIHAEPDEPTLARMLERLDGVGAVVVSAQAAPDGFGVDAFPSVLLLDGGQVTFASFELNDALMLLSSGSLPR